jgi:hypothetical protein
MAWADLNTIHNPATGTFPPATWGDQVRDNFQFLAGIAAATVLTSQTTAGTSYTDLATVGPSVTVTTGTSAIVLITFEGEHGTLNGVALATYAVSGATTVAASDNSRIVARGYATGNSHSTGGAFLVSGLTAGSNTFTVKYRTAAGTATFSKRTIVVIPIMA